MFWLRNKKNNFLLRRPVCNGFLAGKRLSVYVTKNYFSYFSNKTYVVGTQKNHLNETVLLSTQNIC